RARVITAQPGKSMFPKREWKGLDRGTGENLAAPAAATGPAAAATAATVAGFRAGSRQGEAGGDDLESGGFEVLDVVDPRAVQQFGARVVDDDREPVDRDDLVPVPGLVERHPERRS